MLAEDEDWDDSAFQLMDQIVEQHNAKKHAEWAPAFPEQGREARQPLQQLLPRRGSHAHNSTSTLPRDHSQPTRLQSQRTMQELWRGTEAQRGNSIVYEIGSSRVMLGNVQSLWEDQAPFDSGFGGGAGWGTIPCDIFDDGHKGGIAGAPETDAQHATRNYSTGGGDNQSDVPAVASSASQRDPGTQMPGDSQGNEGPVLLTCQGTTPGIKINPEKARHWVYPSHVPKRDYQVSIVSTALLSNTLCCLPTGLGKTMIAAVVMYNYYRWFPEGKIVFIAPTKPLVEQQIEACRLKTGLPNIVTHELTGTTKTSEREKLWDQKRVFYCTPATLNNDLAKGICPMEKIVCLVVDECHRATGNHPIVQAIRQLRDGNVKFRVLGLSATPGSKFESVQEVIRNLMIAKIEFRSESDPDVAMYSFKKELQIKVVSSAGNSELQNCRALLLDIQRGVLRLLRSRGVFWNPHPEKVQRFSLLQAYNQYKENPTAGDLHMTFQQAIFLASTFEQLEKYGLKQAHEFVEKEMSKAILQKTIGASPVFKEFRSRLCSLVQSGGAHPKMAMLEQVVMEHFSRPGPEPPGRVIVFTNLRESVQGIVSTLEKMSGIVNARWRCANCQAPDSGSGLVSYIDELDASSLPSRGAVAESMRMDGRAFVGQGGSGNGGMKQRDQKKVLQDFRLGRFNVLVATCIGEEGLDIPAVDLIICFDGAASPTRNIQRMGRTGRHKEGKVVYILAEGKEEDDYERNQQRTQELHKHLRSSGGGRGRGFELCTSVRMVPRMFNPLMLQVDLKPQDEPQDKVVLAPGRGARGRGRGARGQRGGRGRGKNGPGWDHIAAACDVRAADDAPGSAGVASSMRNRSISPAPIVLSEDSQDEVRDSPIAHGAADCCAKSIYADGHVTTDKDNNSFELQPRSLYDSPEPASPCIPDSCDDSEGIPPSSHHLINHQSHNFGSSKNGECPSIADGCHSVDSDKLLQVSTRSHPPEQARQAQDEVDQPCAGNFCLGDVQDGFKMCDAAGGRSLQEVVRHAEALEQNATCSRPESNYPEMALDSSKQAGLLRRLSSLMERSPWAFDRAVQNGSNQQSECPSLPMLRRNHLDVGNTCFRLDFLGTYPIQSTAANHAARLATENEHISGRGHFTTSESVPAENQLKEPKGGVKQAMQDDPYAALSCGNADDQEEISSQRLRMHCEAAETSVRCPSNKRRTPGAQSKPTNLGRAATLFKDNYAVLVATNQETSGSPHAAQHQSHCQGFEKSDLEDACVNMTQEDVPLITRCQALVSASCLGHDGAPFGYHAQHASGQCTMAPLAGPVTLGDGQTRGICDRQRSEPLATESLVPETCFEEYLSQEDAPLIQRGRSLENVPRFSDIVQQKHIPCRSSPGEFVIPETADDDVRGVAFTQEDMVLLQRLSRQASISGGSKAHPQHRHGGNASFIDARGRSKAGIDRQQRAVREQTSVMLPSIIPETETLVDSSQEDMPLSLRRRGNFGGLSSCSMKHRECAGPKGAEDINLTQDDVPLIMRCKSSGRIAAYSADNVKAAEVYGRIREGLDIRVPDGDSLADPDRSCDQACVSKPQGSVANLVHQSRPNRKTACSMSEFPDRRGEMHPITSSANQAQRVFENDTQNRVSETDASNAVQGSSQPDAEDVECSLADMCSSPEVDVPLVHRRRRQRPHPPPSGSFGSEMIVEESERHSIAELEDEGTQPLCDAELVADSQNSDVPVAQMPWKHQSLRAITMASPANVSDSPVGNPRDRSEIAPDRIPESILSQEVFAQCEGFGGNVVSFTQQNRNISLTAQRPVDHYVSRVAGPPSPVTGTKMAGLSHRPMPGPSDTEVSLFQSAGREDLFIRSSCQAHPLAVEPDDVSLLSKMQLGRTITGTGGNHQDAACLELDGRVQRESKSAPEPAPIGSCTKSPLHSKRRDEDKAQGPFMTHAMPSTPVTTADPVPRFPSHGIHEDMDDRKTPIASRTDSCMKASPAALDGDGFPMPTPRQAQRHTLPGRDRCIDDASPNQLSSICKSGMHGYSPMANRNRAVVSISTAQDSYPNGHGRLSSSDQGLHVTPTIVLHGGCTTRTPACKTMSHYNVLLTNPTPNAGHKDSGGDCDRFMESGGCANASDRRRRRQRVLDSQVDVFETQAGQKAMLMDTPCTSASAAAAPLSTASGSSDMALIRRRRPMPGAVLMDRLELAAEGTGQGASKAPSTARADGSARPSPHKLSLATTPPRALQRLKRAADRMMNANPLKNERTPLMQKKPRISRGARMFFEEEAEVSDDDEVGGSAGDGEYSEDDGRDLEDFIVSGSNIEQVSGSDSGGASPSNGRTRRPASGDIHMYRAMMLQGSTPRQHPGAWHSKMMNRLGIERSQQLTMEPSSLATAPSSAMETPMSDSFGDSSHEDICTECGVDGELLLCDSCPRSFHLACAGLHTVPEGSWFCRACTGIGGVGGLELEPAVKPSAPLDSKSNPAEVDSSTHAPINLVDDDDDDDDDDNDVPNFEL